MKPRLIPEARRAWRMLSVQVAAVAVVWGTLPVEAQAAILEAVGVPGHRMTAVLGLLVIVARLVDQPRLRQEPDHE